MLSFLLKLLLPTQTSALEVWGIIIQHDPNHHKLFMDVSTDGKEAQSNSHACLLHFTSPHRSGWRQTLDRMEAYDKLNWGRQPSGVCLSQCCRLQCTIRYTLSRWGLPPWQSLCVTWDKSDIAQVKPCIIWRNCCQSDLAHGKCPITWNN